MVNMGDIQEDLTRISKDLEYLNAIDRRSRRHQLITLLSLFAFVIYLTLIYLKWELEPDPLVVEYSAKEDGVSVCKDFKFEFTRYVKSTKDINIYVQERYHDLSGAMDRQGVAGELVISKPIHYFVGKNVEKNLVFYKDVPPTLPMGNYEYRPWVTYQVNPIKTITKPLPVQQLVVNCKVIKE